MTEETLVLIKPDAVERNLIGKILMEYERNGLKIIQMKILMPSKEIAETHYAEHKGKAFFKDLLEYITSGPVVALILKGEDAVNRVRILNGATNPRKAADNTIRALYALTLEKNSVHASDSLNSAKKEISVWFPSK